MLIENKWVVYDAKDDMYYTGDDEHGEPVMEHLNSRVRTYKNERGANGAIRHIEHSGSECAEFLVLKAVHIKNENVPDVLETDKLPDKPPNWNDPPIINKSGGWTIVDSFGKIKYAKKNTAAKPIFAVLDENGDLRGFGFDELGAWLWYSDLRREVGTRLIKERM